MDDRKKKAIINILTEALKRETQAFNYYTKAGPKAVYPETGSLLIQLAEEERRHRSFLIKEIQKIESLLSGEGEEGFVDAEDVRFPIPENPDFKRVQTVPFIDLTAISLPIEMLGGDYLDALVLERNGHPPALGVFLYDVMGHGMEATQVKALGKQAFGQLRELWVEGKTPVDMTSPREVMEELNRRVIDECRSTGKFITSFYGVFDPAEKAMIYTSAGHEPPVFIKRGGKYIHLEETELLLGADENVSYSNITVPIGPGDVFALFSDGITEAANKRGKMFERTGLRRAVESAWKESSAEIIRRLLDTLRDFLKGEPITDEFTLVVMKVMGGKK
jgi:sigma-B regulation protein RsbU (phosphoserine phosphatase)